jgi:hypothetical protein
MSNVTTVGILDLIEQLDEVDFLYLLEELKERARETGARIITTGNMPDSSPDTIAYDPVYREGEGSSGPAPLSVVD